MINRSLSSANDVLFLLQDPVKAAKCLKVGSLFYVVSFSTKSIKALSLLYFKNNKHFQRTFLQYNSCNILDVEAKLFSFVQGQNLIETPNG